MLTVVIQIILGINDVYYNNGEVSATM